jgi:hypothetical protein
MIVDVGYICLIMGDDTIAHGDNAARVDAATIPRVAMIQAASLIIGNGHMIQHQRGVTNRNATPIQTIITSDCAVADFRERTWGEGKAPAPMTRVIIDGTIGQV